MKKVTYLSVEPPVRAPAAVLPPAGDSPLDTRGRPLRELRISVTDRCNFRCTYCMPRDVFGPDHVFLPQRDLLSFEEITRLAAIFARLGVGKIRLTGGEPLLRKNVETLVGMLGQLRSPDGDPLSLTMTSNGVLLPRKAEQLKQAGLERITVSLDALDAGLFAALSDSHNTPEDVLAGIDAAAQAGLGPVKVNMVVRRGRNDGQILPMVKRLRGTGHTLRFIEFMDVGNTNGWDMREVMPSAEVLARIHAAYPIEPIETAPMGRVAQRWRFLDGAGEIGTISSVTQPFCAGCTRARLSPEGKLFLCLFGSEGYDLRGPMRAGASDEDLARRIAGIWQGRGDRYSELRSQHLSDETPPPRVEMSYIGG